MSSNIGILGEALGIGTTESPPEGGLGGEWEGGKEGRRKGKLGERKGEERAEADEREENPCITAVLPRVCMF